jgi:hypothetical protein
LKLGTPSRDADAATNKILPSLPMVCNAVLSSQDKRIQEKMCKLLAARVSCILKKDAMSFAATSDRLKV